MEQNNPLYKEILARAVAAFIKQPEKGTGIYASIWGVEAKDIREEAARLLTSEE
mgnify:CR=1 FL=1